MISLENISIGYHRNQPLLSHINLSAGEGEMVALVGRNGTGKSTLLRSLLGLLPLLGGECSLSGVSLGQMDHRSRAKAVSYVSSQVAGLPSLTVRELVSLGRMPHTGWIGRLRKEDLELVEHTIREVGMERYMERSLDQLSDGERQRVMIARALVQDTPHVVLDEPAAYLDIPNKYELVRLLSLFRDRGKTIIYSTHDLETALMCADKFWVIRADSIHEGSPEDLGLSGLFDQLFDSSGIAFDMKSGRFVYSRTERGRVALSGGPEEVVAWTRHALERIGFAVGQGEQPLSIEVLDGEKAEWKIKGPGSETILGSLYKLARFLTQDI
ncbi:MAG: ABC transporter ATP-binding protein [Bacteroidetes bacterium]|nr:ABC transporter ATP-binding protein [Bacteroidota bacterium]